MTRRIRKLIAIVFVVATAGVGIFGYPKLARHLQESAWIEDLTSPDLELRKAAIEGLAQYRTRRAVDPLIAVAKTDEAVGPDAARAVSRIGDLHAIDELKALLVVAPPEFRRRAAAALSEPPISPGAAEGLFVIAMNARGEIEKEVLAMASAGLRDFGGDYVFRFAERLSSEDLEEVLHVARVLKLFGEEGLPAADALVAVLGRGERKLCSTVAVALGQMGPAVVPKLSTLLTPDAAKATREGVVTAIAARRSRISGTSAVSVLLRLLTDPDYIIRRDTVHALARVGVGDPRVASALIDSIYDPDFLIDDRRPLAFSGPLRGCDDIRADALQALTELNQASEEEVSRLLPLLEDSRECVAAAALLAVVRLRPTAESVVASVDRRLESCDLAAMTDRSLSRVLRALGQSSYRSDGTLRFLRRVVESRFGSEVWQAKDLLLKKAPATLESTLQALREASGAGYSSRESDLARNVDPAHIPDFVAFLDDSDPNVRRGLCGIFRFLGKVAEAAVPGLIARLEDTDPAVRTAALDALRTVAAGDVSHLEHYLRLVRDAEEDVSRAAIRAIGSIGVAASEAIPELARTFDVSPWQIQRAILRAVVAIDAGSAETERMLTETLADADLKKRLEAAYLFRSIPLTLSSQDALEAVLNETGPPSRDRRGRYVRASAAESLVAQGVDGTRRVIESLRSGPDEARRCAAEALSRIHGEVRDEGITALREAMKGTDPQLASTARRVLERLESTTRP